MVTLFCEVAKHVAILMFWAAEFAKWTERCIPFGGNPLIPLGRKRAKMSCSLQADRFGRPIRPLRPTASADRFGPSASARPLRPHFGPVHFGPFGPHFGPSTSAPTSAR